MLLASVLPDCKLQRRQSLTSCFSNSIDLYVLMQTVTCSAA